MAWILGILGAFFGWLAMAADEEVFGLFGGALAGALLGLAIRQYSRLRTVEARLARLEGRAAATAAQATHAGVSPRPAEAAPAGTSPMPAGTPAATVPVTPAAATPVAPTTPATGARPPTMPASPAPGASPAPPPYPTGAPAAASHPATPRPPTGPSALDRLTALVRNWLFEGNVPVKIGVLVLMFGVASGLKYAADAGWLVVPIELRLAGIAAAAIAGLVWGLRSAPQRPAFGLSLQGGAIGVLLLVVFAAFRYYGVIGAGPAFAIVLVLVAGASVLAVRQNAVALAVLGFIGGYLAPVLISTGGGNHIALFSYYALLNAAVFGIAWFRPWRALNLVGFVFTFVIGTLWGATYYRPELFATVEPFLVLFFLFYVAIPVLYALAGREANGKVDGTLLFGTPLVAFPLQVALLDGERMPLAVSAVAVAVVYALLGTWAVRNPRLRTLAQSAAALGVVFATLAIPLALEARWTSAAWALQGLGMVWLGLRQQRPLTRWAGLALQGLAACAWLVSLLDRHPDIGDRLLVNGHALNLLLLSLAAFGSGWLHDRAGRFRVLPILLFIGGLFWWSLLGLREILVNLDPDSIATAFGGFAAITAVLAALLRRPMAWPRLGWALALACLLLPLLALAALESGSWRWLGVPAHWFGGEERLWWLWIAAGLASTRALLQPRSRLLPAAHIAVLLALMFGAGLSLARWAEYRFGLGTGWWLPLALAPGAALAALAALRPNIGGWPVAAEFPAWRTVWLGILAGLLGLGWLVGLLDRGDSDPLPWLPLFNPLELMLLAGLMAALVALRRLSLPRGIPGLLWGPLATLLLSVLALRACHQLADLPWLPRLLGERLAQAALTIGWCLAGVSAWVIGSRRQLRPVWWLGAGLLVLVLIKLLAVDRLFLGNLTGIASFLAVGLLLVIVGRLAPTPPRSSEETT
ncbi:DUF2339 domain-containing protein [Arenimonas fontis]|uniref:DUF2339 domain-containing protein n=1 Tax=Arenimonas fontis TaxID=2608255 RepID=A0A5B2Z9C1_9GAMM|nr:DUF2339 domain-containing protein [Arenimonas fontis]KAA2284527.1 DUF2339 domain-containing protein [Arenimonas fontis]